MVPEPEVALSVVAAPVAAGVPSRWALRRTTSLWSLSLAESAEAQLGLF